MSRWSACGLTQAHTRACVVLATSGIAIALYHTEWPGITIALYHTERPGMAAHTIPTWLLPCLRTPGVRTLAWRSVGVQLASTMAALLPSEPIVLPFKTEKAAFSLTYRLSDDDVTPDVELSAVCFGAQHLCLWRSQSIVRDCGCSICSIHSMWGLCPSLAHT